ncbi:Ribonuclease H-like domain containing protein, partial [Parasponia andersonii]
FDRKVWMQHDTKVKKFKIKSKQGDIDSLYNLLRLTLAVLAIPYEYTNIYDHSCIGAAERYNIRLKNTIELMYNESMLLKKYWDYALKTVSYILNFTLSDKVASTSFQMWIGYIESLEHLKV